MIRLEDVSVAFGRTVALDSVSLSLKGGITGLFGPNGSGKSTLLRVLAGLVRPTSGALVLDDAKLDHRRESIRARIGYAGHGAGLYSRLSLQENLELFATLYGTGRARPRQMIEALDLARHADKPVGDLSAGLKRRSAVARALLHEPDILLLDEPYANVDDDAGGLISDAITRWRSPERVGIVATHGAKKVRAYADGGVVLQRGRVARAGTYTSEGFVS